MRGAPVRNCKACGTSNHVKRKECSACGVAFEPRVKPEPTPRPTPTITAATATTEDAAVKNQYRQALKECQNLCRDHERQIGRLQEEITKLRQDQRDWVRWKHEAVYNRALEKMIEKLGKILQDNDLETLKKIFNQQAYLNPLGEQFFTEDGSIKLVAVVRQDDPSQD